MTDTTTDLIARLRRIAKVSYGATIEEGREVSKTQREAADALTRLSQRVAALESELAEEKETRRAYEEECQATCAEGIKYWKDRLESQLAARESAEPVAWLTEDGRIAKDETKQCMPSASRENFTIPLFAHPPAAVASEDT